MSSVLFVLQKGSLGDDRGDGEDAVFCKFGGCCF
jgi:hypothetical protein